MTVRNTGSVAGAEAAQLYVHHPASLVEKADVELAGFAKVHLQPGEAKTVSIPVDVSGIYPPGGLYADSAAQGVFVLRRDPKGVGGRQGLVRVPCRSILHRCCFVKELSTGEGIQVDRTARAHPVVELEEL